MRDLYKEVGPLLQDLNQNKDQNNTFLCINCKSTFLKEVNSPKVNVNKELTGIKDLSLSDSKPCKKPTLHSPDLVILKNKRQDSIPISTKEASKKVKKQRQSTNITNSY